MTDSIPDEIMREAREAFHEAIKGPAGDEISIIADALMARDKRAAEIARRKIVSGMYAGLSEWPDGEDIADAILSYDEAQQ